MKEKDENTTTEYARLSNDATPDAQTVSDDTEFSATEITAENRETAAQADYETENQIPETETQEENTETAADAPEKSERPAEEEQNAETLSKRQGQKEEEQNAETETAPPPKKKRVKRILLNTLLVIAIALGIVSLFGVVKEIGHDASATIGEVIRGASPLFCIVLLGIVLAAMVLDVFKFCIISKTVTGKFHLGISTKTNFLGKYYDAVTPFSTGGQPMQIYYLNTKGISGGNSSAIVLIRYIFSILCWIILGAALMIAGSIKGVLNDVSGGNLLKIAGWIGIGVNLIVPFFVLFFVVFPKVMTKITVGVVRLGHKMKMVKDVDKATVRATKVVGDFKNSFKLMATNPVNFIALVLVCFGESALTFSIPYFVMKAFSCPVEGMALTVMSLNVFAIFGVSFIPTPGNSGVMEGMGALAFSVAAGTSLIWSVITWRFAVFYIYIFVGLGITVYDIIRKNAKHRRERKPVDSSEGKND